MYKLFAQYGGLRNIIEHQCLLTGRGIRMRIEKLNSNKVRVTLTGDDMMGFDINAERLSRNSAELHNFLFKIMDTVHKETGFNLHNGQVVVEAQSMGDGMTILISKINCVSKGVTETVRNGKRIIARVNEKRKGTGTYYFESFDDLCKAVTMINDEVHSTNSLYRMENGYCYLLDFENPYFEEEKNLCEVISVLREFSSKELAYRNQHIRVREYGEFVAKNEELISMAENLRKINKI